MHLFRRGPDLSLSSTREASSADLSAVSRLFHGSTHRFLAFQSGDLPALLAGAPAMLLVAGDEVWAAAITGGRVESTIWLRGLTLANGLPVKGTLDLLLPPLHALLGSLGLCWLYYAGDDTADTWLQPPLNALGFVRDTSVIVYEKHDLNVPSTGNQEVRVRRVEAVDLPSVLALDHACFAPQWSKDEGVIGPSIFESPYFIVAELAGAIIGYAFVTTHFGGRLVHLVRIAVLPEQQGRAIGVRLLAEVTAYARTLRATSLTLNTQADNAGAQRLYEWFGFRRTGEQQPVLRFDLRQGS